MKLKLKTKLRLATSVALAMSMSLSCVASAFAAGEGTTEEADTTTVEIDVQFGQTEARSMLSLINDLRTGETAWAWNADNTEQLTYDDLGDLTYDYGLEEIAMQRAAEIAVSYSHTRPNGGRGVNLFAEYYAVYGNCYKGENIAAGQTSAQEVFTDWAEEDEAYANQGHRRNMLGLYTQTMESVQKYVGIGHVVYNGVDYWVQEFASVPSGSGETAANDSTTTMEVEVQASQLSSSTLTVAGGVEAIEMDLSGTDLPDVTAKFRTAKTWPYNSSDVITGTVLSQWTAQDDWIVIEDGKISATQAGTSEISMTALGTTITLPVTVTCNDHSFTTYVSDDNATCTEDGTETALCDTVGCGVQDSRVVTGTALGHSFTNYVSNGDGTMTAVCNNGCGTTDTLADDAESPDANQDENNDAQTQEPQDENNDAQNQESQDENTDAQNQESQDENNDAQNQEPQDENTDAQNQEPQDENNDAQNQESQDENNDAQNQESQNKNDNTKSHKTEQQSAPEGTDSFADVSGADWYGSYVEEVKELGLMVGMGDGSFAPKMSITRAMAAQILYNMENKPEVEGWTNPFTDVSANDWFADPVEWAYQNNVTKGTSDTTFSPEQSMSREEIAVFLYEYAGAPEVTGDLSEYVDGGTVDDWAQSAMIWAVQNGIINGVLHSDGTVTLSPNASATRAEVATMLVRYAEP